MENYIVTINDKKNFSCTYKREGSKVRIDFRREKDMSLEDVFKTVSKAIENQDKEGYSEII